VGTTTTISGVGWGCRSPRPAESASISGRGLHAGISDRRRSRRGGGGARTIIVGAGTAGKEGRGADHPTCRIGVDLRQGAARGHLRSTAILAWRGRGADHRRAGYPAARLVRGRARGRDWWGRWLGVRHAGRRHAGGGGGMVDALAGPLRCSRDIYIPCAIDWHTIFGSS
jgi:hypothetical protein